MCKKLAIVLDVDGILLKSEHILREIYELDLKGDDKWDYFHKRCNEDDVPFVCRRHFPTPG